MIKQRMVLRSRTSGFSSYRKSAKECLGIVFIDTMNFKYGFECRLFSAPVQILHSPRRSAEPGSEDAGPANSFPNLVKPEWGGVKTI